MVSASLFSPNAVGHDDFDGVKTRPPDADDRYPLRPGSLISSLADYIDLHVYSSDHTRAEFDGAELTQVKPLLLGETGAFKNNYPNASSAGRTVQNVMTENVNYGFTGWGIWTWDTIEQLSLWTLVDNNNTMNNILAPSVWPFMSQVYQTIELKRFVDLAPPMNKHRLEKIIVNAARHNDVQVRIEHKSKILTFGTD
ncbi:unnamed protein product [Rotaria magnacalcarata]|uniref:Mannan endo-1,4-beta-mannosidase n=1 Tax=Rotaria magnacalcarata TaxID=392030 RepID=A0A815H8N1_9BILA|nr:unnamed protein product [Rotaria magnacalcarata]CAF1348862.1 unnamed protein product [Rotaria magnacalcarata]CAF3861772.1 unnamed protein product [Rotaria magnacalcarata]CAF4084781.1 unnamed protein product [Rotaria magnacalcarata]